MTWRERAAFLIRAVGTLYTLIGTTVAIGLLLWLEGRERDMLIVFSSVLAALGIVKVLKVITNKKRPSNALIKEKSGAFPSGHAAMAMTLAVLVLYLTHTHVTDHAFIFIAVSVLFAAFLVSASRIILRVHTLFEVVAGVIIGALIPLVIVFLIAWYEQALPFLAL